MTPIPHRAEPLPPAPDPAKTPEPAPEVSAAPQQPIEEEAWSPRDVPNASDVAAGGRQVLGIGLSVLAALWLAYCAWSAGRSVAGQPLSSPMIAQWVALAAGPLALLGLVWLMFGRTRRKETERFTQSVIAMRSEAQSLEALLQVLSHRIDDSRAELTTMAQRLMKLGDETTGKFAGIAEGLDSSSDRLRRHGDALDRAAESARNDIAVLLHDLPRAEESARSLGEQLRSMGSSSAEQVDVFGKKVVELADRTRKTERVVEEASDRLSGRLAEIESAGGAAAERVGKVESELTSALDILLERTSATLEQIRGGIGAQSEAVAALVQQASTGLGRAGADAAESLATNVERANTSLGSLSQLVAEQDRASQKMIAEIDRGLTLIDERFAELASRGDERANRFLESLTRARTELDALAAHASTQDSAIGSIVERTATLRATIDQLTDEIRDQLGTAIGEAQGGTDRLAEAATAVRPEIGWIRDAALEAGERMAATGERIAEQQDRFAALLATVDDGVGDAHSKLGELAAKLSEVEREAASLSAETAPTLVSALVQVKDAAAHAAERAREAIESVIPASATKLSDETRSALEQAIREGVEDRLREVESVAARAIETARAASDRLSQQMITIGQSAAALEQHIEQTREEQREKDSEAFARRVSLLIDSMHSAAIDVGKILSDEIDDKAWGAYLKGNRGVFTSRAVRLMDGSETRALRAHYDEDLEFQRSVNRYVHDFEAMLRRVMAERDGGIIAVTLMSSDMGKLYAALAQAIDKRR
jgi:predicted  nucleic acid-binding Zn-ribbon protein